MAPSSKKPVPPVEANTVAPRKLIKLRFAECAVDPDATEEPAPNMTGYSLSCELERRFKRSSPRLCVGGPRAFFFFPEVPSR